MTDSERDDTSSSVRSIQREDMIRRKRRPSTSHTSSTSSNSRSSIIWKYYEQVDGQKYACMICMDTNPDCDQFFTKNSNGSTTNFWRHLEVCHIALYEKLKGKKSRTRQSTITEIFSSASTGELTRRSFQRTNDKIGKFIYKCDEPWRMVEDSDIRDMLRYFAQKNVKIPNRKTIQKHATTMYEQEKKKFIKVLEGVRGVSLTVDAWTTDNMIPFLGITIHWIDDTWTLRERVPAISKLAGEHTGDHLGIVLHTGLCYHHS